MELKVWVEGIQRIVCGVTEITTCQDVVYALAHATGKTGRFTLMEKWRNSERLLAPLENPLKILLKWGEYASDVQFILHRTALDTKSSQSSLTHHSTMPHLSISGSHRMKLKANVDASYRSSPQLPNLPKDIRKSFTFSGVHRPSTPSSGESASSVSSSYGTPEVGFYPPLHDSSRNNPIPYSSHLQPNDVGLHRPRFPPPPPASYQRSFNTLNRPLAPPPYELVRGNPPPPPPFLTVGNTTPTHNLTVGNTIPTHSSVSNSNNFPTNSYFIPSSSITEATYSNASSFAQIPPRIVTTTRELPPYRDPPPPPFPITVASNVPSSKTGKSNFSLFNSANAHADSPSTQKSPQNNAHYNEPSQSKYAGGASPQRVSNAVIVSLRSGQDVQSFPGGHPSDPSFLVPMSSSSYDDPSRLAKHVDTYSSKEVQRAKDKQLQNVSHQNPAQINTSENSFGFQNSPDVIEHFNRIPESSQRSSKDSSPSRRKTTSSNSRTLKETGEYSFRGHQSVQSIREDNPQHFDHTKTPAFNNNTEEVIVNAYYKDIVRLVNDQRDKISNQQIDLTKFDAEILYLEGHWKEEEAKLSYLKDEIQKLEVVPIEEENDSAKLIKLLEDQLKTAKKSELATLEEISVLKEKLAAIDAQLIQMNKRAVSIQKTLEEEKAAQERRAEEEQQTSQQEKEAIVREVDKLQVAVVQAAKLLETTQETSDKLADDLKETETRLEDKRKEIEDLSNALKAANLEALSLSPQDESKPFAEGRAGSMKSGSNRRMLGSPRELETAVPTTKNPHGVWV